MATIEEAKQAILEGIKPEIDGGQSALNLANAYKTLCQAQSEDEARVFRQEFEAERKALGQPA